MPSAKPVMSQGPSERQNVQASAKPFSEPYLTILPRIAEEQRMQFAASTAKPKPIYENLKKCRQGEPSHPNVAIVSPPQNVITIATVEEPSSDNPSGDVPRPDHGSGNGLTGANSKSSSQLEAFSNGDETTSKPPYKAAADYESISRPPYESIANYESISRDPYESIANYESISKDPYESIASPYESITASPYDMIVLPTASSLPLANHDDDDREEDDNTIGPAPMMVLQVT